MMATLVLSEHVYPYEGNTTLVHTVDGDHQQTVIDFAVRNQSNTVHEKEYIQLAKQCGFVSLTPEFATGAHFHDDITDVVHIRVKVCREFDCDECYPPFSFPLIIDFSQLDVSAMYDKFFRLCDERQVDSTMIGEVSDIIDSCEGKVMGMTFFLLVEEDGEGGYTVKETRLGEHGAEFLRSCERI